MLLVLTYLFRFNQNNSKTETLVATDGRTHRLSQIDFPDDTDLEYILFMESE